MSSAEILNLVIDIDTKFGKKIQKKWKHDEGEDKGEGNGKGKGDGEGEGKGNGESEGKGDGEGECQSKGDGEDEDEGDSKCNGDLAWLLYKKITLVSSPSTRCDAHYEKYVWEQIWHITPLIWENKRLN